MIIAYETAEEMGLDMPGLKMAREMYEMLASRGGEDDGTQALFRLYD
jgi:3-hydroxyisobutyrate dehydrogenase